MTQQEVDLITEIFRSALGHLGELNQHEFLGGVGIVTMLVSLAFASIVVPIILRILGYIPDDD